MGVKDREHVQVLWRAHPPEQDMDVGPYHQPWKTDQPDLQALPHTPRVGHTYDGAMPIFQKCLARAARVARHCTGSTTKEWISPVQDLVEQHAEVSSARCTTTGAKIHIHGLEHLERKVT
jgi:hypothetical protein